jgi:hypothetical protein
MPGSRHPELFTYWPMGALNEYGIATPGDPELRRGRWEDRDEVIRNTKGDETTSKARVFLDTDVEPLGYLARGDFTDSTTAPSSLGTEIKQVARTPNLRYSNTEIKAYL